MCNDVQQHLVVVNPKLIVSGEKEVSPLCDTNNDI